MLLLFIIILLFSIKKFIFQLFHSSYFLYFFYNTLFQHTGCTSFSLIFSFIAAQYFDILGQYIVPVSKHSIV